jgi:hypothetical protein
MEKIKLLSHLIAAYDSGKLNRPDGSRIPIQISKNEVLVRKDKTIVFRMSLTRFFEEALDRLGLVWEDAQ